jgi:hypothetical protein
MLINELLQDTVVGDRRIVFGIKHYWENFGSEIIAIT